LAYQLRRKVVFSVLKGIVEAERVRVATWNERRARAEII
jgi:hypothetical protein